MYDFFSVIKLYIDKYACSHLYVKWSLYSILKKIGVLIEVKDAKMQFQVSSKIRELLLVIASCIIALSGNFTNVKWPRQRYLKPPMWQ